MTAVQSEYRFFVCFRSDLDCGYSQNSNNIAALLSQPRMEKKGQRWKTCSFCTESVSNSQSHTYTNSYECIIRKACLSADIHIMFSVSVLLCRSTQMNQVLFVIIVLFQVELIYFYHSHATLLAACFHFFQTFLYYRSIKTQHNTILFLFHFSCILFHWKLRFEQLFVSELIHITCSTLEWFINFKWNSIGGSALSFVAARADRVRGRKWGDFAIFHALERNSMERY